MRTNIVIDDALMEAAMHAGGYKTKRDAVEEGLRLVARRAAYQKLRSLRGKLAWSLEDNWSAAGNRGKPASVQEPSPAYVRPPAPKGKKK
jgi:antitoxin ParD1/3/4